MAFASEYVGPNPPITSPIHDALEAGVEVLSGQQTVPFTPYVRTILPLDGFTFWLNANLLSAVQLGQHGLASADPVVITGSLHYASQAVQKADETIVVRRVDFTAEEGLAFLAAAAPTVLYVGRWQTELGPFAFAFSRRSSFYQEAGQWHLIGDAVYPAFEAQLIDGIDNFSQRQVVSNSLPIWLSLPTLVPFPSPLPAPRFPIYPAFLVSDNLVPPYAAVNIPEDGTRALQPTPLYDANYNRWQLAADRVRVTLYGLRNDEATGFFDYVEWIFEVGTAMGLMNAPVIRDGQRTQPELTALAMQKLIDYEVSYYQFTAREIARQLITSVVPAYAFSSDPFPNRSIPVVPTTV